MPVLLRLRVSVCFVALVAMATATSSAQTPNANTRLDVVSFKIHADGDDHKMVVTLGASLVRVDEPSDRYSIIYDPKGDDYIGLEHGNYTYWEFSWPAVKAQVAATKRYEARLRNLIADGASSDATTATNATTNDGNASSSSTVSDDSGFVWKQTTDKKQIAGLDCLRWTGDSATGESVEAWCYAGPLPKIQAAINQVRAMNEPVALVPIRTLIPPFVLPVYDGLVKSGVTPLLITWGGDQEKNSFGLEKISSTENKPSLFAIPKLYVKTTLVTMDGITNPVPQKK